MRTAVVTAFYDNASNEESLVARRIAGALACSADVDVLVAQGPDTSSRTEGALKVLRFPARDVSRQRKNVLWKATLGRGDFAEFHCSCIQQLAPEPIVDLPIFIKEEFVRSEGGNSNQLYEFLRSSSYDAVVFIGYKPASTYFGIKYLPKTTRVVVVAMASEDPLLDLDIYDSVFDRAECFLVISQAEKDLVARRVSRGNSSHIRNVAFALNVSHLAKDTVPIGFNDERFLVIASDRGPTFSSGLVNLGALIAAYFSHRVQLLIVGRGWESATSSKWMRFDSPLSRSDLWRWMTRALAVIDPQPKRILGREVLEAMMYGVPVLVRSDGGATREHAELGNGGLWFRNDSELCACIEALLSGSVRDQLGVQGKEYAQNVYGDPDRFIRRVTEAVLG
jgi:glycosyltransferase involved in cell wall biosynthesis